MEPFVEMSAYGHEQVVLCRNEEVGLKAIIAIHDTTLGPSLGGCRVYNYASEADAMRDVLRLSRGMTYKAAVAGLDLGGGKSVIIGDPSIKSEGLFRAFGRHIESLGGRYITAEDMNTHVEDMNFIARETRHVLGAGAHLGGSGDPSPVTAWGLFHGIRACLEVAYGSSEVSGRTVAIQGVGNVGFHLARHLHDHGARIVVSDINNRHVRRAMEELGAQMVEGEDIFDVECDVLAPCAIGGVINERTIPKLRCPIVAGGANNILEDEGADADRLGARDILYGPDYVVNAGGLMSVYSELVGWPRQKALDDAENIFNTVKRVLHRARIEDVSTVTASNRLAVERIESVAQLKRLRV
ncbi:MAG: Glu/Leu/Phe/Val dehydrogenase [Myxococcota bacterium]